MTHKDSHSRCLVAHSDMAGNMLPACIKCATCGAWIRPEEMGRECPGNVENKDTKEVPMGNVVWYEHQYSSGDKVATVAVDETLKGTHRAHCLCWRNCARFKPGKPDNCKIAQALYELCVKYDLTTPVFECPIYDGSKEATVKSPAVT